MPNENNVQNFETKLQYSTIDIYSVASNKAILLPLHTF
ncbi:MAG: hypothetical protein JWR61_65 [Ferruginibacter sp.]|jgi:hypothetical protein|nr:hypothetical protein [Ferruginibacter sp.]